MDNEKIIEITPDNIYETGALCGNDFQFKEGMKKKIEWYRKRYEEGLRIKISINQDGIKTGMIEYVPGEYAWRTVKARGYTVIHCLQV